MKLRLILGSLFLVVGIVIFCILEAVCLFNVNKISKSMPISATIERIETTRDVDGDRRHAVYVSFINPETNNQETDEINVYYSGMHEGKEIDVYYDPETGQILSNVTSIITGSIGGVFLILFGGIGAFFMGSYFRQKKKEKRLMSEGKKIQAIVIEVKTDYGYKVNNRPAMFLVCEGQSIIDGQVKQYKSTSFFGESILEYYPIGSMITVYIDYKNDKDYIVDLTSREQKREIY